MEGLEDLRKLSADLSAAGPKARAKAGMAVRKSASDIVRHAITKVPVDTGATMNSIGADITTDGNNTTATIGPTTSYAPFLENGTRRMQPRPFMGPALDAVEPGFVAAMEQLGGEIL